MSLVTDANTSELIHEAELLTFQFITARYALEFGHFTDYQTAQHATHIVTTTSARLVRISRQLDARRIVRQKEFEDMVNVNCIVFLQRKT